MISMTAQKQKRRAGFTLIEMIVVIAIIAVLIALVAPLIFVLAPGAFLVLGYLMVLFNKLAKK